LKREGRFVNNKYKDEMIYSDLRFGNNSKLNKFRDIAGINTRIYYLSARIPLSLCNILNKPKDNSPKP